jgi:predicted transcriptional regulator
MDGPPEGEHLGRRDLAWEARLLAEAETEAEAGLLIPSADVKAWLDSLGTANPLPMPLGPHRSR